jgi:magnesium transporter
VLCANLKTLPLFIGNQIMRITHFNGKQSSELSVTDLRAALDMNKSVVWVDMTGPTQEDTRIMQEIFNFHPLSIEDTMNQNQRAKAEEYSDHLFVILNPVTQSKKEVVFRELDIFVGSNYVVTVHSGYEPVIGHVRKHIDLERMHIPLSPTYLLYIILDHVVDGYFPLIDQIEEEINDISSTILMNPSQELLNRVFEIKRTLSEMWRVLWPQRDIMNVLINHKLVYIDKEIEYYLRDVSDHLLRIGDMVHILGETLSGLTNLYVSALSNQLNKVVNRLAVVTVVIGILTVISGFYGMNFEKTWPAFNVNWGVPFVLLLMATLVGAFLLLNWWWNKQD